jgi:hypothetical protein
MAEDRSSCLHVRKLSVMFSDMTSLMEAKILPQVPTFLAGYTVPHPRIERSSFLQLLEPKISLKLWVSETD